MAAASVARPAAPARAASPFPSVLSLRQGIGILGVVLGAAIVTLAGRLLSLGLADLRGHVGISADEGAWIGSAFNVAIMFIGPLTVYLGGLMGPRRILLVSAAVFTAVSIGLPFVHSYSLLIALLAIAGLSAGTFYPLTLSFALRNTPGRLLAFTLGLYALAIEGAVNFAPSLYGFYRVHLSWEWIFVTSAIVTPLMMACVSYGIPPSPRPRSGTAPSFVGFLYASAGLALIYAALDQAQRLDWWRSGVFTALVAAGVLFLLCSAVRRLRGPNPLVDLAYLRQRNTVLLGTALFAFRFVLLGTILIIPLSLSVRGFDASQIGPAIVWTALLELCLAFVAAYLLNRGFDSRLLMAIGFAAIAVACVLNAELTSAWSARNYFRTELLMAVGQSFAMIGLVATIVLQAVFSGGLASPQRALTFSAYFHVVRLFGGQVGAIVMARFISEGEKLHSYLVGLHVQPGDWITDETLRHLTTALAARSNGLMTAAERAGDIVGARVRLQAYTLTLIDAFHLVAWGCVFSLLLIALLRRSPLNLRELVERSANANQENES